MAEGLLGGLLGGDDEASEVEAPIEARAGADAFAAALAVDQIKHDPAVAKAVERLLDAQTAELEEQRALRLRHLENQSREGRLAIVCPITSRTTGYRFELPIDVEGVSGVIIADQARNLDWRARNPRVIAGAPKSVLPRRRANRRRTHRGHDLTRDAHSRDARRSFAERRGNLRGLPDV